ncbi:MAG: cyclic nucleotide-binding domain-containing protein [Roseiarcus sp.]
MSANFFDYSGGASPAKPAARARLESLSDEDWEQVVAYAARRRYSVGAVIAGPKSDERAIFVIADGEARVEGAAKLAEGRATLENGDVFGYESFFAESAAGASVVAASAVEVLMLSPEAFEQLAAWRPRVAILILRDLAADLAGRLAAYETPI